MEDYEDRLLRVLAHIHAHPAGDLSLDALAEVAAMSRFHWHRVFHAMTGETLAAATRRIRLHRAAVWLLETGDPVEAIATRVGYANKRSFARSFAEAYGMSPMAYRTQGLPFPPKPTANGGSKVFPIEIEEAAPRRLAALSHTGPYPEIGRAFEMLGARLGSRNLWPQVRGMAGVYYDDPDTVAAEALRAHAGAVLADGAEVPEDLEEVWLPGGKLAVMHFKGPYAGLGEAYGHLYGTWLPASGEEPRDAPPFEVYLNSPMDTAPPDLLTDVCVPLR